MRVQTFKFEIPDLDHPYPEEEVSPMGPSGPLSPFEPEPVDVAQVIGREIDKWTPYAGTYGMGGPGFMGFRFESEWLIIAIWGAGNWLDLDGRLITDMFWQKHHRTKPWEADPNSDFDSLFVGRKFTSLEIARDSLAASFDDGRALTLSSDSAARPLFEGNGEARSVGPEDDLRRTIFMAPTSELWIE